MTSFTTYVNKFDPSLLTNWPDSEPEYTHRSIGRPSSSRLTEGQGVSIEWPWEKHGRAKKVISRAGARRRYIVPSFRDGDREVHCEAHEEALAAVLLDACAGVQFQEQPATIRFQWNNEEVVHYPDFLAVAGEFKEFVECKRDHELGDLYIRCRTDRLVEVLSPLGYSYRLASTSQLEQAWYLQNAIRMRRRAKLAISDEILRMCHSLPLSGMRAAEILSCVDECERINVLYALLYQGVASARLEKQLSLETIIGPPAHQGARPWVWELFGKVS